jgi:hypothetical protein
MTADGIPAGGSAQAERNAMLFTTKAADGMRAAHCT